MAMILDKIQDWFSPIHPLPSGLHHYISPPDDPRNYRLHLRIEPDGRGVLILNAATVLHLNETATEIAYYIIKNYSPDKAAKRIASRYKITRDQAHADYQNFVDRLQILINTPDLDPETFLDFKRIEAHGQAISAPYRLDCALTYQQEDHNNVAAPVDRVRNELSTAEWKIVFDTASRVGIPQIILTGGEPTLRPDLIELIGHIEANNQVTGLITNGIRFSDLEYLNQILSAGLDHIMMVFEPEQPNWWSALKNVIAADIFLAVHLTLTSEIAGHVSQIISDLAQAGVCAISLSTDQPEFADEIETARNQVAANHIELVWNLPVPYSSMHPVALETVHWEQNPGAGHDWLYIEPDGDVLPMQGVNQVLGNMLSDAWEKIWKK